LRKFLVEELPSGRRRMGVLIQEGSGGDGGVQPCQKGIEKLQDEKGEEMWPAMRKGWGAQLVFEKKPPRPMKRGTSWQEGRKKE